MNSPVSSRTTRPGFQPLDMPLTTHQRHIIAAVLRQPNVRRNEVAEQLGLSPQTMMRAINPLVEAGLLTEIEGITGERGKPPRLMSVNTASLVTLGSTVVADRVVVEFADLAGQPVSRHSISRRFDSAEAQLDALDAAIAEATKGLSDSKRVVGAVVIVQGYFLVRDKTVVAFSDPVGWSKIDLQQRLTTRLGIPLAIVNDGKAFAGSLVAESPARNFIGILVGSGIGGGIVCNGQLLRGHMGNAGEFGRLFGKRENRPTELSLRKALNRESWDGWPGLDKLPAAQKAIVDSWLSASADMFGHTIDMALALLDFEVAYIGSRMPEDLLSALCNRIELQPLGFDLDNQRHAIVPNAPALIPYPIQQLSTLANQMALERFIGESDSDVHFAQLQSGASPQNSVRLQWQR